MIPSAEGVMAPTKPKMMGTTNKPINVIGSLSDDINASIPLMLRSSILAILSSIAWLV
ncbi:MAG: hypothetical protein KJ077_40695 [Anaerolineae bacterium]|nr:hypothetical protein [Anaerolineae bacterium]